MFMKKAVILSVLFMMPLILSLQVDLSKDVYYPGETLQAEITGDFVSLKGENVLLYREGVPRSQPVISDLVKRNNVYHFYALLPNQVGNFSLVIEGAEYFEEGALKDDDFSKEFVIEKKDGNKTILSLNPGFVEMSEDFFIKVKSLNKNSEVSAEFKTGNETRVKTLSLIAYAEKKLEFSAAGVKEDGEVIIGDYKVPVFFIKKGDGFADEKSELVFFPSSLEGSVVAGKDYIFNLVLINIGENDLKGIELSVENGKVIPNDFDLNVGGRIEVNVSISIPKKIKGNFSDVVTAKYSDREVKVPVKFEITKKNINLTGTSTSESLSCSVQSGFICSEEEECVGEISPSLEGNCCKGNCVVVNEGGYGFYIGIILLVIIISIAGFLVWRARKKGKLKSPKDILKERVERGRERMEPSSEVSGSLGRE